MKFKNTSVKLLQRKICFAEMEGFGNKYSTVSTYSNVYLQLIIFDFTDLYSVRCNDA